MSDRQLRFYKLRAVRMKTDLSNAVSLPLNIENVSKLQALVDEFRELKKAFDVDIEKVVLEMDDSADNASREEALMKDASSMSNILGTYEGKLKAFYRTLEGQTSRDSLVPSDLNQTIRSTTNLLQPKVEKIKIPKFDGNILNFANFKGLFENLVHNNPEISNVQKLYYLKLAMVGDAKDIVRDFELSDAAYAQAWSLILNRFDNKRLVIKILFRKLIELETIKHESKIRSLLDQTDIILRGLKAAGEKIDDTFSKFVAFLLTIRLDPRTAKDFENSLSSCDKFPKYEEIQKFLQVRSFALDDNAQSSKALVKPEKYQAQKQTGIKPTSSSSFLTTKEKISCLMCSKEHKLSVCKDFATLTQPKRFDFVKEQHLCLKCLLPGHSVARCKAESRCVSCNGQHHSLLHRNSASNVNCEASSLKEVGEKKSIPSLSEEESSSKKSFMSIVDSKPSKVIVLPTAVVTVRVPAENGHSNRINARLLLDTGSQPNTVSEVFIRRHRLPTQRSSNLTIVSGITGDGLKSNHSLFLDIESRYTSFKVRVEADVVPEIPFSIESKPIESTMRKNPKLSFAEMKTASANVDIILGAEFYEMCMLNETRCVDGVFLRNSHFGWILSGPYVQHRSLQNSVCTLTTIEVQEQLKRFWEIEEVDVPQSSVIKVEHEMCSDFVLKNLVRDSSGRFVTRLPLKCDRSKIGESRSKAVAALKRVENKYDSEIREQYVHCIQEYLELGHMEEVDLSGCETSYFIPHRAVLKPSSTTTKLRVIFNASCPSSTGVSLNDILMVGPTIQPELVDVLMRFRQHSFAFSCDITKMYRQILVHELDRDLQCVVWRSDVDSPIQDFRLNTVTFGTAPASFIATKCLEVLGDSIKDSWPIASRAIKNDFVMDDLLTGANTLEEASVLQQTIHATLNSAHFPLRKYMSNSSELLSRIPSSFVEQTRTLSIGSKNAISLLGLCWQPKEDRLTINLKLREDRSCFEKLSKRLLLSEIAKIYDPIGLIAPMTIRAKLLLQQVWQENCGWDDVVSPDIVNSFVQYYDELSELNHFYVRCRYSSLENPINMQLVGFCDASERAYAAVVYLRSFDDKGNVDSYIVAAKSKVAPKNEFKLTIPKLELQAAELLSRLLQKVSLALNISSFVAYTDSTTVLAWLSGDITRWTVFVQNRVRKITCIVPICNWFYVNTKSNPADLCTRGISAKKLVENILWLNGPNFLREKSDSKIVSINKMINWADVPEMRKVLSCNALIIEKVDVSLFDKYSSYVKLVNVLSYAMHFIHNCKMKVPKSSNLLKKSDFILTLNDKNCAINYILRLSQRAFYLREIDALLCNKPILKSSSIYTLSPFLDENNILRFFTRLNNANLPYDVRNPIILNAKCKFVWLFISHVHIKYYHASRSFIKRFVSTRFHIVHGLTNVIKKVIRQCNVCIRFGSRSSSQFMGQLPLDRVSIARPFSRVGVDFGGPFKCKCINHRAVKFYNVYMAMFVCFVTRAVHIEIVSDLSSQAFINTIQRFVARRGIPSDVFSDNGTNFVGASNYFQIDTPEIKKFALSENLQWHFIPPRAPHHGGIWEAAVKSAKFHLLRVTKGQVLNYEEYLTVFANVECIMNSRPLCYKGGQTEPQIITPAHFLIGDSLMNLPIPEVSGSKLPLTRRFELLQNQIRGFWKEWSSTYLNSLKTRNKWLSENPNIQVGDVVILKVDQSHPSDWPIAMIEEVHPGVDGVVRVVTLRFRGKITRRSINQVIPLTRDNSP